MPNIYNSTSNSSIPESEKITEDWGDYKRLPEEISDCPLTRRLLLGADSVVHTPMLRAFETNESGMTKFSESMDPCFVGRKAAVLQNMQFAYADESTRRRMSNAVSSKPGRFEEEWAKLYRAPTIMRGKADLQDAALIVMSAKPELSISGKLLTRTSLAPFG